MYYSSSLLACSCNFTLVIALQSFAFFAAGHSVVFSRHSVRQWDPDLFLFFFSQQLWQIFWLYICHIDLEFMPNFNLKFCQWVIALLLTFEAGRSLVFLGQGVRQWKTNSMFVIFTDLFRDIGPLESGPWIYCNILKLPSFQWALSE